MSYELSGIGRGLRRGGFGDVPFASIRIPGGASSPVDDVTPGMDAVFRAQTSSRFPQGQRAKSATSIDAVNRYASGTTLRRAVADRATNQYAPSVMYRGAFPSSAINSLQTMSSGGLRYAPPAVDLSLPPSLWRPSIPVPSELPPIPGTGTGDACIMRGGIPQADGSCQMPVIEPPPEPPPDHKKAFMVGAAVLALAAVVTVVLVKKSKSDEERALCKTCRPSTRRRPKMDRPLLQEAGRRPSTRRSPLSPSFREAVAGLWCHFRRLTAG